MFPIIPIKIIKKKSFIENINLYFLYIKKNNKKIDAIINLKDATEIGLINSTEILIAIKAEPQIALKMISKKRLLDKNVFSRNYLLFLGSGIVIFSKGFIKSSL